MDQKFGFPFMGIPNFDQERRGERYGKFGFPFIGIPNFDQEKREESGGVTTYGLVRIAVARRDGGGGGGQKVRLLLTVIRDAMRPDTYAKASATFGGHAHSTNSGVKDPLGPVGRPFNLSNPGMVNQPRAPTGSYANIVNGVKAPLSFTPPALILEDSCLIDRDFSRHVLGKELFTWNPVFLTLNEKDCNSDIESVIEPLNNIDNEEEFDDEHASDINEVPETVFGANSSSNKFSNGPDVAQQSEGPFGLNDLLNNKKTGETSKSSPSLSHPPGFTPDFLEEQNNNEAKENLETLNAKVMSSSQEIPVVEHNDHLSQKGTNNGGYVLDVMEDVIRIGEAMGYSMEGPPVSLFYGIIYVLLNRLNGETIVMGDFNEVRSSEERRGSCFNPYSARRFDRFIHNSGLVDIKLEGYTFTWSHPSPTKMSQLDRFLVSDGINNLFPSITAICLDRHISDHRPILFREVKLDFGPTPFRFYHSRFDLAEPGMIKEAFINHFKAHFKEPDNYRFKINFKFSKRLSQQQTDDLERAVSRDDIKTAVWNCGDNKSPGPDGYSFGFIKKYSDLIGTDLCEAVEHFFVKGSFPNGCNSSFIALIPKVSDAKLVSDFCPISLIGCVHKVVTKVIANRLTDVISDIVSDTQSAFVSGRQILDGPFILGELLQWCKRKNKQSMFFKVDFAKAYDLIRWDYLLDVLEAFGFGPVWCKWIRGSLNSAKTSILINGSPSNEFSLHCGLKQGDPLAPYLFILIMESLHLSIRRLVDNDLLKGIQLPGSVIISHLFYADDAMFIGEWSDENLKVILNTLKCFFLASGVTVGDRITRIKAWENIIVKLRSRLSKWKVKTLYVGGRLALLKSVLGASPIYSMSIFKVPREKLNSQVSQSFRREPRGGIEHQQLSELVSLLDSATLNNLKDRWYCDLSGDGEFRVKDLRNFIDDIYLPSHTEATRWVKLIRIKLNIFVWRARRDCLPTRSNLFYRGVNIVSLNCPICHDHEEVINHTLFCCDLAQSVLKRVCGWWNLDPQGEVLIEQGSNNLIIPSVYYAPKVTLNILSLELLDKQGFSVGYDGNRCNLFPMFKDRKIHYFDEDRMRKMQNQYLQDYFESIAIKEGMEQEIVRIKGNLYSTNVQTFNNFVTFLNLIKHDDIVSQEWDYFRNRFNKLVKWFFNHYLERSLPGSISPIVNGVEIHLFDLYKLIENLGGYLSVHFSQEFDKVGEIMRLPKGNGEEIRRCYMNFLEILTSHFKTARAPSKGHTDAPLEPALKAKKDRESLGNHQCISGEYGAQWTRPAVLKGKEVMEHSGVQLEDTTKYPTEPTQAHYMELDVFKATPVTLSIIYEIERLTRLGEGDKANISNDSHVLRLKVSTSGPLNKHSEKMENFHAVISTPRIVYSVADVAVTYGSYKKE
nr:RNA-directed DNA polymerase, eukaryota [Tanacetum cinerariifolium]